MKKTEQQKLNITMFGNFTLTYESKDIVLSRNNSAKFVQLLQLIWLRGEKGITKDQLLKALYDREALINYNNSFNNLVYQTRRQMVKAGLPEMDYIIKDEKIFRLDPKVTCNIDVHDFQILVEQGDSAKCDEERLRFYEKAFGLYKGELLPDISTELWVTIESSYYKELFRRCIQWLGQYYYDNKKYNEMYRIYERAAGIYPFDEWQVKQIEAMLCQGNYKDAFCLYDKTVRLYSDEIGLPPSEGMLKCYEMMSQQIRDIPGEISEIKEELREDVRKLGGVLVLTTVHTLAFAMFIDC